MSERVSWEACPDCRRLAAVGWLDGTPVEVDCPNGCDITPVQVVSTYGRGQLSELLGQVEAEPDDGQP